MSERTSKWPSTSVCILCCSGPLCNARNRETRFHELAISFVIDSPALQPFSGHHRRWQAIRWKETQKDLKLFQSRCESPFTAAHVARAPTQASTTFTSLPPYKWTYSHSECERVICHFSHVKSFESIFPCCRRRRSLALVRACVCARAKITIQRMATSFLPSEANSDSLYGTASIADSLTRI